MSKLVSIYDARSRSVMDGQRQATIGVNWAAIGPISPRRAQQFARAVLRQAAKAQTRANRLRAKGYKINLGLR